MQSTPPRTDIPDTLVTILSEALRKNRALIRPESRIIDDLGAESIDVLDIRFRMERAFGFKIGQDEIRKGFGSSLSAAEIRARFTVESLVRFVVEKLGTGVNTA